VSGEGSARGPHGRWALEWLLDRIFAIRPLLWIPAVAVYGAGRAWEFRESGREGFSPGPLAALLLILAAVHGANAWRDRDGDRLNRKGLPIRRGPVARGASLLEQGLLLVSFVLGLAYVAPPLELKRRPILDVLSHGAGYGVVAFLLGAAGRGGPDDLLRAGLIASLPYALGIMTVSLLTMLADLEGDEKAGQRTTAVALGSRRAVAAATALAWATMAAGLWARDLTPALWGTLAAAILALGPGPGSRTAASWNAVSVQLQLLFLAILAPQAPVALLVAILIGGATEAYNRWRWGVGYPLRAVGRGGA